MKQNSIGYAIIQASRPRSVIAPIMFGVGIEMYYVFGSKWLINELSHLGFSISYDEACSCRKHGLKCVKACGDCRGENCRNAEETTYLQQL